MTTITYELTGMSNMIPIVFNGVIYRRYPDSNRKQLRNYYFCGSSDRARGFSSLHRDIWISKHGNIPDGYQIHHKDGDPLNNKLSNLECLSPSEHRGKHRMEGDRLAKQKIILDRIRPLAAAWHSSSEGIAWHSKHASNVAANLTIHKLTCLDCGAWFTSTKASTQRCKPCSVNYYNLMAKQRHPLVCENCGIDFTSATKVTRFCCRSCRSTYVNSVRVLKPRKQ